MQFIKFLSVGVINTVIGYGTFLVFLRFLAIDPEVANAIGYLFALTVAFFLNKNFVFGGGSLSTSTISRFIFSFLISFSINQSVLHFFYHYLQLPPELSQIPAMLTYTIAFFLLNKFFVFKYKV